MVSKKLFKIYCLALYRCPSSLLPIIHIPPEVHNFMYRKINPYLLWRLYFQNNVCGTKVVNTFLVQSLIRTFGVERALLGVTVQGAGLHFNCGRPQNIEIIYRPKRHFNVLYTIALVQTIRLILTLSYFHIYK